MPSCSRARWKSSRQKRLCCVHSNWSTFKCGRNEHSMPAPQAKGLVTDAGIASSGRVEACDKLSPEADADAVRFAGRDNSMGTISFLRTSLVATADADFFSISSAKRAELEQKRGCEQNHVGSNGSMLLVKDRQAKGMPFQDFATPRDPPD